MPKQKRSTQTNFTWDPGHANEKQLLFYQSRTMYTAYGGARGGGKTHAVRIKAVGGAFTWPGIRILIVRKTYPELQSNHIEPILKMVPQELTSYNGTLHTLYFQNGSTIHFGHWSGITSESEYQGQEYDWIFMEEATQFTESQFRTLGACLRGATKIPRRMYLTCNPGGIGHLWVKRLFIDKEYRDGEKPEDYTFIPALGYQPAEFWKKANTFGFTNRMDGLLAYMYTMIEECKAQNIRLDREFLVKCGHGMELFPGVQDWFGRINAFGESLGVDVEHYVISSGLREIIEGSGISHEFKEIYACEFFYNEEGLASWPKLDVNFTNKTQFVYRINKGVLDVSDDRTLNASMPDDSKRIPFTNMIYIGDGLSDVPCMKMMRSYGGEAIAVYQEENRQGVEDLLSKGRVDFIFPADYRAGTALESTVQNIIRKMSIVDALTEENSRQLRQIGRGDLPYQASLFE